MKSQLLFWLQKMSTLEFWESCLAGFECLGPAVPFFLALLESLIPALPLVAIVTLNVAAHGSFWGFLYSWAGASVGSVLVFLFFRRVIKRYFQHVIDRSPKLQKAERWVNGFDPKALFLIAVLPFTPSSFLNMAFGVSDFDEMKYIRTIVTAKSIMIALLALFGQSLAMAMENPLYIILSILLIGGLYLISRRVSRKNDLK